MLLTVLAWEVGLLFVVPVLWMVLTSFHSETDAATNPPSVFAPLSLEGYQTFFEANPWPPLLNSLTAAVLSTTLVLVLAFPAAYALSIRPVKAWTDVLFFFLSTKMMPVVAGILPLYLFAQKAHLLDNIWWLIVLYTSMNLPIAIWMLRSFLAEVGVGVVHLPEPAPVPPVDPAVAELHGRLKASFDPTGRLNPGVSPLSV
jgi:sorbitol/mannitol transport system permease protein